MTVRHIVSYIFFLVMLAPTLALAAGLVQIVPSACNDLGGCQSVCQIGQLVQNILNDGIILAVLFSSFVIIYEGGVLLSAGGDQYKIKQSKKRLLNILIGTALIVGAWAIVNIFITTLAGSGSGLLQWNRVC